MRPRKFKVPTWLILFLAPIVVSVLVAYQLQGRGLTQQPAPSALTTVASLTQTRSTDLSQQGLISSQIPKVPQPMRNSCQGQIATSSITKTAIPIATPLQTTALADATNYGNRYTQDALGNPVQNELLVVLHETVISAKATVRLFQTPHPKDDDQASYHALVNAEGTIIYLVPSDKRAFGAGNSVFMNSNGPESVQTNPKLTSSVNNFAYHISLESPIDGENESGVHSGYTEAQYQSLAWLVNHIGVKDERITTHYAVDRTGKRKDPRSFDFKKFFELLHYSRVQC
jgi:hypothetical protein